MAPLDDARFTELIARGTAPAGAGAAVRPAPGKYNGMADPAGAEELGRDLADRLREIAPDAVVVWEDPEDVVLGHVVARELGVRLVHAFDADGLVGTNGELPDKPRVALVADAVRDGRAVLAARAIAGREGGSLVATAVLVGSTALDGAADEAGRVIALSTGPQASTTGEPGAAPASAARPDGARR
jgi:adenine/guanine phosphoribosyltransferase-like PRPP-binding protein